MKCIEFTMNPRFHCKSGNMVNVCTTCFGVSECVPSYKKLHDTKNGFVSTCKELEVFFTTDEYSCLKTACQHGGGNLIVFRHEICSLRQCEDSDLQLVTTDQGWTVFNKTFSEQFPLTDHLHYVCAAFIHNAVRQ